MEENAFVSPEEMYKSSIEYKLSCIAVWWAIARSFALFVQEIIVLEKTAGISSSVFMELFTTIVGCIGCVIFYVYYSLSKTYSYKRKILALLLYPCARLFPMIFTMGQPVLLANGEIYTSSYIDAIAFSIIHICIMLADIYGYRFSNNYARKKDKRKNSENETVWQGNSTGGHACIYEMECVVDLKKQLEAKDAYIYELEKKLEDIHAILHEKDNQTKQG